MKDPETDRLVAEMEALPPHNGWQFGYEYPGYFCYGHPDLPYRVAFTPDWEGDQELPIQVTDDDGHFYEEHSPVLPLPRAGRTGQQLLDLVRPTLDKLSKLPPPGADTKEGPLDLHVSLTTDEVAALKDALDHVRVHMAHHHPWAVRDAAMIGLGKVLTAASLAKESSARQGQGSR